MLRTFRREQEIILEVRDNGAGMTEEVRRRCTETHFSTKRDNAIYEGHSTGMGLGLSFVVAILEHHRARLEIRFRAAIRHDVPHSLPHGIRRQRPAAPLPPRPRDHRHDEIAERPLLAFIQR